MAVARHGLVALAGIEVVSIVGLLCWEGARRRREAEGAIRRRAEAHHAALVTGASDLIAVTGASGKLTYVSPASRRMLGYGSDQLVGTTLTDLIHPEDREKIQGIHQHSYATGEPYEMIERIVRPDGEIRYLRSNGQVVMGAEGAPERMRGTCVDITEQYLAEREREATAVRLSEVALRRKQTVEINDNIVQGVTAAMYALELDDADSCRSYLESTLAAARTMMEPDADLVRSEPAKLD